MKKAAAPRTAYPNGTITFLFTDIERSSKLWEVAPDAMRVAVSRHDALLRQAVEENDGYLFKNTGDGIAAAFSVATQGLAAALMAQQALGDEPWPPSVVLRSRMGLHTGAAELRDGDYFGSTVNRAARLMEAGHGGQTLLSDVTNELCRDSLPPEVILMPLGEHRLKDLARPEAVYQLAHSALKAEFPQLRTLDVTPNNLPQQVTSFVGREKPLAEVIALLHKTRLLTLTGAGGSGKTRLSLQASADALENFPSGAWLVELAAISDPSLVPQTLATALGVRERAGNSLLQTLTDFLRPQRLLVILDNCEHVLAACSAVVSVLIRSCPQLKVLATSREPLGIGGELTYRVPSLTLPDRKQKPTLESLSQYEAVRLFVDRAQFVKPNFTVTNANAPALAQLCWRLDGIPLAIELAAARVRSMPVEQINDKLDGRFRLLTGGDRSALPRQQTLRALIDWSYDILAVNEKILLARLSVFAGGWTLDAAEAVCCKDPIEDWEVLDLLTSLVDKSLVLAEEQGGAALSRYRMLETVRQYAAERLSDRGEAADIATLHREFFVVLGEQAESELSGRDQAAWLSRLESEHDNFRGALDDCAARASGNAESALAGLRLSSALSQFWRVRGYLSEGRERLARALAKQRDGHGVLAAIDDSLPWEKATAAALSAGGLLASSQGDYGAARSMHEDSLAIFRRIGVTRGIATALGNLGHLSSVEGDYKAAWRLLEDALSLHRGMSDALGIATTLDKLGGVAWSQGDYPKTKSLNEESLPLFRAIGDKNGIATALGNLGNVAWIQGDYGRARSLHEESLGIRREIGFKSGIAVSLGNLSIVAFLQGDYTETRTLSEESLTLFREIERKPGIAISLCMLGRVACYEGDYATAKALCEEGLTLHREIGIKSGVSDALASLGEVAYRVGDYVTAKSLYAESLSLSREIGDTRGIACGVESMASVCMREGSRHQAATLWGAAEVLRNRIGAPLSPIEQADQDEDVRTARAVLGDEALNAAWAEGRSMSEDLAIEHALR